MPRYFFHLHNSMDVPDHEGRELVSPEAAREHAIVNIRELMCEAVQKGELDLSHRIDVADEAGKPVMTVRYAEAVTLAGTGSTGQQT